MLDYTLKDWEYLRTMFLSNTEGYERMNPAQLAHIVKMLRHFLKEEKP